MLTLTTMVPGALHDHVESDQKGLSLCPHVCRHAQSPPFPPKLWDSEIWGDLPVLYFSQLVDLFP